jgi:hypothetical protein
LVQGQVGEIREGKEPPLQPQPSFIEMLEITLTAPGMLYCGSVARPAPNVRFIHRVARK